MDLFNESEQQLANFCEANRINSIQLKLMGQGDLNRISPVGLNTCVVSIKKCGVIKYYYFGCIREHVYDELVSQFDRNSKITRFARAKQ